MPEFLSGDDEDVTVVGTNSGWSVTKSVEKTDSVCLVHEILDLGWAHPPNGRGLIAGARYTSDDAASEHKRDDTEQHVLVDTCKGLGLNLISGLFLDFAA
jgi:hypothetical protein